MASVNPIEDQISCAVCFEVYRDPHILTECLHTFCLECINQLQRNGRVQCPQCRVTTTIDNIKRDFNTQGFIDAYNRMTESSVSEQHPTRGRDDSLTEDIDQKKVKINKYIEKLQAGRQELEVKCKSVNGTIQKLQSTQDKLMEDIDKCTKQAIEALLSNQNRLNDGVRERFSEPLQQLTECREFYQATQTELQLKAESLSRVLDSNDTNEVSKACSELKSAASKRLLLIKNQTPPGHTSVSPTLNVVASKFDPKDVVDVSSKMKPGPSKLHHVGVQCDGCHERVYGVRFKCFACPDFDLCESCEERNLHSHHAMIRLRVSKGIWSLNKSQRDRVRFVQDTLRHRQGEAMPVHVVHEGIGCDGCEMFPVRGVRYKCCLCVDYDLCETCEGQGIHSQHEMIKIKVPKIQVFQF